MLPLSSSQYLALANWLEKLWSWVLALKIFDKELFCSDAKSPVKCFKDFVWEVWYVFNLCDTARYGCQIQIFPYKSRALGDCFKNQLIAKQTVRADLHLLSIQQWDETLAMLYKINPIETVLRGEKCRRNKDLSKFLEVEIPLFKVLFFTFFFTLFTTWRYCAMRKMLFHFESSLP